MSSPVATVVLDLEALTRTGGVTVQAPAPLLLTAANAEAMLGLTRRQFQDAIRAMRRDPAWAGRVIAHGKIRAVEPADLVAYLREQTPHPTPANDATPAGEDRQAVLERWGVK